MKTLILIIALAAFGNVKATGTNYFTLAWDASVMSDGSEIAQPVSYHVWWQANEQNVMQVGDTTELMLQVPYLAGPTNYYSMVAVISGSFVSEDNTQSWEIVSTADDNGGHRPGREQKPPGVPDRPLPQDDDENLPF